MKIFAFIPARYSSKRFPGKALALIAGKPMIQHVYERAMLCPEFSDVYVATDDEQIFNCIHEFGGRAVMTEEQHRCGTDRIGEAAVKIGVEKEDLIINIQGDQPLFHPSVIPLLTEPILKDKSIHMTTLKYKIIDDKDIQNTNNVKVVTDMQGFALYFSRNPIPFIRDSELKKIYYKHLGFYGYRMDFLMQFSSLSEGLLESTEKLEQLRALEHGFKIKVLESAFDSIEVDLPKNIEQVEASLMG